MSSFHQKQTLLDLTQTILEKMDSDEVNSIFDTVESRQVAAEIRDTFYFIVSNSEDYKSEQYIQLNGISDPDHFNQLLIPENVCNVLEFWYIDLDGCRHVPTYLPPREFVDMQFKSNTTNQAVHVYQSIAGPSPQNTGPAFPVRNNKHPEYYTTFDDQVLFMDGLYVDESRGHDTAQNRRSGARVSCLPQFKMEDTFVPVLKADEFSYLLNEATDACFIHFKGVSNSKAQKRARDQKVSKQTNRNRVNTERTSNNAPPYGRFARGRSLS